MNGPHLATRRFEVGNVNLNPEKSNNLDMTLNYEAGNVLLNSRLIPIMWMITST